MICQAAVGTAGGVKDAAACTRREGRRKDKVLMGIHGEGREALEYALKQSFREN